MINFFSHKKKTSKGFTFIELMVAISIASIVVTLTFLFYRNSARGLLLQNSRIEKVETMVIGKNRIETVLNSITAIHNVNSHEIEFFTSTPETLHRIQLKDSSIFFDTTKILNKVKSLDFSSTVKQDSSIIVFWSSETQQGGWIGGAIHVYR
jgi:prepilin-type N-terminal cleavage/methylation domain-containing protein